MSNKFVVFSAILVLISTMALALPLRTLSNQIVDSNGDKVRLHCVNWYGAHMENHISNGLNAQSMDTITASIRSMGFNCVRLPFSTELYYSNPVITNETVIAANMNLMGKTALEVLDLTVESLTKNGLMVILNNHIGKACWCCSETDGEGLWYTETYPESKFIESWTALAARYKSNSYVVGADLRNEIRSANGVIPTWGDGNAETDWHAAATRCGNAVLEVNPNLLIIVESLSYSTDFTGVAQYPIMLNVDKRLVYSPHDYGWSQKADSYEVFKAMMERQWGYILTPGQPYTAPLWLSEFGTDSSSEWWGWIRQYIAEKDLSWSYWALDGLKYVGVDETFGLFMQDYVTIRHDWKLADLQKLMEN